MKALYLSITCIGVALCGFAALRMMTFFENIITTDKQLLLVFFSGVLIACVGFLIETYNSVAHSTEYKRRRKMMMNNMIIAIIGCIVLLCMIIFGLK